MSQQTRPSDPTSGHRVALTFLLVSAYLYFNATFLGTVVFTYIVSLACGVIGIIGIGIELNKLAGGTKTLGLDDLGIGIGLLLAGLVGAIYLTAWWLRLLLLPIIFFGVYGTVGGILKLVISLVQGNMFRIGGRVSAGLVIGVIAQVIVLIAAVLQSLQIMKVLR